MTDATRAEEAKALGNAMFSKGKLQAAIEAYSEAICFEPSEPVYYTNRAMCHRRREAWESVISDCEKALSLDDTSIKGHYLLGVALEAGGLFPDAVRHLHRALELCKDRTIAYKDDIQRAMLLARKREWQAGAPQSEFQVGTTSRLVTQLVDSHYDSVLADLPAGSAQQADAHAEADMVRTGAHAAIEALRDVRGPGKVPDYYCCKITVRVPWHMNRSSLSPAHRCPARLPPRVHHVSDGDHARPGDDAGRHHLREGRARRAPAKGGPLRPGHSPRHHRGAARAQSGPQGGDHTLPGWPPMGVRGGVSVCESQYFVS